MVKNCDLGLENTARGRQSQFFIIRTSQPANNMYLCFRISLVTRVSFETHNLCTFLLGLFRSIVSSLVNDYYLISFLFQSVCTRYYISYFIAISCCRRHQFCLLFTYDPLSAIYLQSLGARPK